MKKLVFMVSAVLLFTGCAFTVSQTPLNYSYQGRPISSLSATKLNISQFIDKRDVTDNRVIFQKRNDYGDTTSGAYEAERPLVDIIHDAVVHTFQDSGVTVSDSSSGLRLEGELISNDYQIIMGFWKSKVTNTMTMKFELINTVTNQIIWQDTLFGKYSLEASWGGAELMLKMVKGSIDDLIYQLMSDDLFRQQLQK